VGAAAILNVRASIRSINLASNDITVRGAKALATALPGASALQALDLSMNGLGDQGAAALCLGLLASRSLQSVRLNGCSLGNAAGRHLISTVKALSHSARVGKIVAALKVRIAAAMQRANRFVPEPQTPARLPASFASPNRTPRPLGGLDWQEPGVGQLHSDRNRCSARTPGLPARACP